VDLLGSETGTEGQNATWHATESTALLRHLFLHGHMESMGGEIHRIEGLSLHLSGSFRLFQTLRGE